MVEKVFNSPEAALLGRTEEIHATLTDINNE
jgi:hypothetical protein